MLDKFTQLDSLLRQNEALWRFEPFHLSRERQFPWRDAFPQLCDWIATLSEQDIHHYKQSTPALLSDIGERLPVAAELHSLSQLPLLTAEGVELPRGFSAGIPGRKLDQILSMGSFALSNHEGQEWLEWCSGKGYLGQILAVGSGQAVTSFEWQESLCLCGQREADSKSLPMIFVQGDALSPEAKAVFKRDQHAIALHACGDLHVRLLEHATSARNSAITISPCCYHLTENPRYQPLSQAGRQSGLSLDKSDLRIPLQETVTGGERVARHREEEMSFRLALDLLLRHELGYEEYLPIPSIKKSLLGEGFEFFCAWAAEKKNITLPRLDYSSWEERGRQRFWQMERLSLIQQLFRRPLELWLVYDRALFLGERGYEVTVAEFCHRTVTPRNIIIHASRV